MKPKIKTAFCFDNGNIAVCDTEGAQITELQLSWPIMWAKHAESLGYDPDGVTFETTLATITIHRCEGGWNFEAHPKL